MLTLFRALLALIPFTALAGPLSGGGGGMDGPPACKSVSGNIAVGTFDSAIRAGRGTQNQLTIEPSEATVAVEGAQRVYMLQFATRVDRYGRIYGQANFEKSGCDVELTAEKMLCGMREMVRVSIPFWFSEYINNPQKFGSCVNAVSHPDYVNAAPSGYWFE